MSLELVTVLGALLLSVATAIGGIYTARSTNADTRRKDRLANREEAAYEGNVQAQVISASTGAFETVLKDYREQVASLRDMIASLEQRVETLEEREREAIDDLRAERELRIAAERDVARLTTTLEVVTAERDTLAVKLQLADQELARFGHRRRTDPPVIDPPT